MHDQHHGNGHRSGSHEKEGHGLFAYRSREKRKLLWSLIITTVVMGIEIAGGLLTHSIALLSDAGHMFTHSFAILIGLAAILIARRPQCHHRTFGLYRAEVLAAFVNGLFLLFVAGVIVHESIQRILDPQPVLGGQMLLVAGLGLVTNLISIAILKGAEGLNVRGVFLHLLSDAASSVGIVITAIVIMKTGWTLLDPLVSIGISILIVVWASGVLKESVVILLEMAPAGMNTDLISGGLLSEFPELAGVENLHVWSITSDMAILSARVVLRRVFKPDEWERLRERMDSFLRSRYGVIETTLQPRFETAHTRIQDACEDPVNQIQEK